MHLYAAPLQGYTEGNLRNAMPKSTATGPDRWYTPFIRVEAWEPARRDMRQLSSPLKPPTTGLVPQDNVPRRRDECGELVTAIMETTTYAK